MERRWWWALLGQSQFFTHALNAFRICIKIVNRPKFVILNKVVRMESLILSQGSFLFSFLSPPDVGFGSEQTQYILCGCRMLLQYIVYFEHQIYIQNMSPNTCVSLKGSTMTLLKENQHIVIQIYIYILLMKKIKK